MRRELEVLGEGQAGALRSHNELGWPVWRQPSHSPAAQRVVLEEVPEPLLRSPWTSRPRRKTRTGLGERVVRLPSFLQVIVRSWLLLSGLRPRTTSRCRQNLKPQEVFPLGEGRPTQAWVVRPNVVAHRRQWNAVELPSGAAPC